MRAWQRWHATSCYACGRNLAYQSGAAVVKCPGCEYVLNVRGLALHQVAGQAECAGCHQIMVFHAAAVAATSLPGLMCTTCSSYTPAPPPLFFNCAGCGLYLTYCARLHTVICAVCLTVFPPSSPTTATLTLEPLNPALGQPPRPPPRLPPRLRRVRPPENTHPSHLQYPFQYLQGAGGTATGYQQQYQNQYAPHQFVQFPMHMLQQPQTPQTPQSIEPTPESPQPQTPELANLQPPLPPEAVAEATSVIQNTAASAAEMSGTAAGPSSPATPTTTTTTNTAPVTSPPINNDGEEGDGNGTNGNNLELNGDDENR